MNSFSKQQGSTLIFAMIFLVVLTFLAVSTMSSSLLDEKMAGNTQFKNQVFQASQSEGQGQFDLYLTDHSFMETEYANSQKLPANQTPTIPPEAVDHSSANISKNLELKFVIKAQPPSGFSFEIFQGLIFDQQTVSSLGATGTSSDQSLGINYAAPYDDTKL